MNRLIPCALLAPLALLAACSGEPVLNDVTQNNAQEMEPLSLPDPVEPAPTPSASASTAAVAAEIPEAFRGRWSGKAGDCGKGSDITRLEITPAELRFYESSGTVTGIEGEGAEIAVTARYTGEGEAWTATRSFELSPDGKTLTSEGMARVRCP
ncbi:hypothetical protein ABS767_16155 [Sphingomonas sp. ST-64]|uniref:Membrane-bound lysozyme-inhibitor of c-type lysozyme n=1 Tax=Sphingomonas plantiphila TaxID=3163295 RepID=A0ABW8YQE2_9SPHN